MQTLADFLGVLGHQSLAAFWLPLGMWTLLALPSGLLLRFGPHIPLPLRYYGTMALLFALPLGLLLGVVMPWTLPFPTMRDPATPVAVVVGPLAPALLTDSALSLNLWHLAGTLTLAALLAAALRLGGYFRELRRLAVLHRTLLAHPAIARPLPGMEGDCIPPGIHVVALPAQAVPMTFGWRRPVLGLPASLLDDPVGLRMSVLHELVHIQQHDFALRVLEGAVEALFGLHPLVAVLSRTSGRFREMVCDAAVLTRPEVPRQAYATLLLAFAERSTPIPSLALCMPSHSNLQNRIIAMNQPIPSASLQRHLRRWSLGVATLLLLGGAVLTACTESAPPEAIASTEQPAATAQLQQQPNVPTTTTPTTTRPAQPLAPAPKTVADVPVKPPPPAPKAAADVPVKPSLPPPPSPPIASASQAAVSVADVSPKPLNMEVIGQNLVYPEAAKAANIQGKVIIGFMVEVSGQVTRPTVLQGIGHGCDEEALRVVQLLRFEPGLKDGKPVATQLALPISFKLD